MSIADLNNPNDISTSDMPLKSIGLKPLTALRALSELLKNKEDTGQVFVIMRALSGRSVPKGYAKLLRTAKGGRIAYRHEELATILSDSEFLKRLPEASVGRAYLKFTSSENISAQGLVDENPVYPGNPPMRRGPADPIRITGRNSSE